MNRNSLNPQNDMKKIYLLSFILILLQACSTKIDLEKFNGENWKNDPNGCKGLRIKEVANLQEIRDKLIGLGEPELQQILGKPDKKTLHERMNHVTTYYIDKGPKCDDPTVQGNALILEYNGLNQLILVTIQK